MVVDRGRYENHKSQSHEELLLIVPSPKTLGWTLRPNVICVWTGEREKGKSHLVTRKNMLLLKHKNKIKEKQKQGNTGVHIPLSRTQQTWISLPPLQCCKISSLPSSLRDGEQRWSTGVLDTAHGHQCRKQNLWKNQILDLTHSVSL